MTIPHKLFIPIHARYTGSPNVADLMNFARWLTENDYSVDYAQHLLCRAMRSLDASHVPPGSMWNSKQLEIAFRHVRYRRTYQLAGHTFGVFLKSVGRLIPPQDNGPHASVLAAYQDYLSEVRGLVPTTIAQYIVEARVLVRHALPNGKPLKHLSAKTIEEHIERRARGINANTNGPFAVIEFTGALPRASLYTDWQVAAYDAPRVKTWVDGIKKVFPPNWPLAFDSLSTNDLATLELLTRASFDPAKTVLLSEPMKSSPSTNANPGTVEFISYKPKDIVLKAKSAAPAILLLNDHYDSNWQVSVDGRPAKLLRCNYLMRGVEVPIGGHQVEFKFRPPIKFLYVSLAAIALGLALLGRIAFASRTERTART